MKVKYLLGLIAVLIFVGCSNVSKINIDITEMKEGTVTVLYADPEAVAYAEQNVLYRSDFKDGKISFPIDSLNFDKDLKECVLLVNSKDNSININLPLPVEKGKQLEVKISNLNEYSKGGRIKVSYEGTKHAEAFSMFWNKLQPLTVESRKVAPEKINEIYSKVVDVYKEYLKDYPQSGFPYMLMLTQLQVMQIEDVNPLVAYCNTICIDNDKDNKWQSMVCGFLGEKKLVAATSNKLVFNAIDAKGNTVTERDVKGKLILVDFWASWCKPCKEEMPHIKDIYNKYKSKGLTVVGISIDRDIDTWKTYIKSNPLPWTSLFGDGEIITKRYDFRNIPYNLLVDENGNVIAKDLHKEDLDKFIADYFSK